MHLGYWIRRPHLIPARIRYWWWERRHPTEPWLCRGAIEYCQAHLDTTMRCLEFGSGRSTAWFAARVRYLTSVEHDTAWHENVRHQIQTAANVSYRLIPLDHPGGEPERETYDPLPRYVAILEEFEDATLDLVVIDGHYRTTCIRASLSKLKPGGLLLVDDVNLWASRQALPIPHAWQMVNDSTNGIKRTAIWQRPL